jgi:hypothetical protein
MVVGVIAMRLFISKFWNWWDIAILKWCCLLYGIAVGAYFHEVVMPYIWVVLLAAILLTIRPAIAYWKK